MKQWSSIQLLSYTLGTLGVLAFEVFAFCCFIHFVEDVQFYLLSEDGSKLDALVLIFGFVKSLRNISSSIIVPMEDLLNLIRLVIRIFLIEDSCHVLLDVPDFLIKMTNIHTESLLLVQQSLANVENLLLHAW